MKLNWEMSELSINHSMKTIVSLSIFNQMHCSNAKALCSFNIVFFSLLALCACQQRIDNTIAQEDSAQVASPTYINPVFDQDFADPTVVKAADGYYYVYATNSEVAGKTLNIQVARSRNLVDWERVGDALPKKPSWADTDFWAPHVQYDSLNKTYYLYYSGESKSEANGKCLGVATAQSPAGPFIDKGEPLLCGKEFESIDPMAFDDPVSGKKLLYWGSGFEPIKVQELTTDRLSFKEETTPTALVHPIKNEDPLNYQRLVEGAWVVYRNGYYYLYYSGDNCCGESAHYAVMVARAKDAMGPFETLEAATDRPNSVILAKGGRWIAPGHNSIVQDKAGQDWIVYHAIDGEAPNKGRVMLIDQIDYQEGWPVVATGVPSSSTVQKPVLDK